MAFHGVFIGIDRYASPAIDWLGCAERDAIALHALFADNLGSGGEPLTGDAAITAAIVERLEAFQHVSEDDFVVITFSGHGSETHELVPYDTDASRLAETALPLDRLAELFSLIPSKNLICVLDCCFSGGAGAKVLRVDGRKRSLASADSLLNQLGGEGRLILTASSATEPAWEKAQVGHGLLTYYLLEALQGAEEVRRSGKVSVLRLLEFVTEKVADAAAGFGAKQTATLRGTVDGALTWPVFKAGTLYGKAFPERSRPQATANVASLAAWGFPSQVLDAWGGAVPSLNPLQLDAINEFGVLDGEHIVVSAPTSSGKTMVGELAALKGVLQHRRAIFLLPLKALVNDKHQEFERKYGGFGLRTIRATGEFNDDIPALMQGQYDVCLMTYEKAAALLVGNSHLLRQVGTIVIDEAQMIVDESRGVNLEFLLTLLRVRREQGIAPQLIALSAVIGDTNGLERWLEARLLRREERPVPLREGVITEGGELRYLDVDGTEKQEPFIQVGFGKGSSQDRVIPLLEKLVAEGKKVIVFREQKGETVGCATYLARTLALPPAHGAVDELPTGDPSNSSAALRQVLQQGVAFHNADLDREEKLTIERHFRDPDDPLRVVVATTTLAMGVNTPASAVVVVGLEHPGNQAYSVAEYKNMIGRAGRLGFNEEGESYIIANEWRDEHYYWTQYVCGTPEDLRSRFLPDAGSTDAHSLILRVLASAGDAGFTQDEIVGFLAQSFGAFQAGIRQPGWTWDGPGTVSALQELRTHDLVSVDDAGRYHSTALGQVAGENGVRVQTVIRLVAALRLLDPSTIDEAALVAATQITMELDDVHFPINRRSKNREPASWLGFMQRRIAHPLLNALGLQTDVVGRTLRAKKATACLLWMSTHPRADLEREMVKHGGPRTAAGPIQQVASRTCDLLPTVRAVAEILHPGLDLSEPLVRLLVCLEIGLPLELASLATAAGRRLTRAEYLAFHRLGYATPEALFTADDQVLKDVVGSDVRTSELRRALRAYADQVEAQKLLDLILAEPDAA